MEQSEDHVTVKVHTFWFMHCLRRYVRSVNLEMPIAYAKFEKRMETNEKIKDISSRP